MADKQDRWQENSGGKWFVDKQCIDCDLCRTTAPENFARSKNGYSFVSRQPRTPDEEALCRQALKECPVEAIGDDA
jgi:ferredoxin